MKMDHIAIIMDGNRRFAKKQGLPSALGHKAGAKKIFEICELAKGEGVKFLTLFAFSSENWNRSKEEVQTLMELLEYFLTTEGKNLVKNKIRLKVIGDKTPYSVKIQNQLKELEEKTAVFKDLNLIIALNYGGRADILNAVNILIKNNITEVNEKDFEKALFTADIPDPELLIRTGGDIRISNFLLWQIAYTELFFTKTLWPEFGREDFKKAIEFFRSQKRNFGK